jgi:hypothetical protein
VDSIHLDVHYKYNHNISLEKIHELTIVILIIKNKIIIILQISIVVINRWRKIVNCKRHHVGPSHNDSCIPLTTKFGFSSITSNDHPSNIAFTSHKIM